MNATRLLWAAVLLAGTVAAPARAQDRKDPSLKILDGKPKTIVCITNSHRGGKFLEQKLARYFDGKSPITVRFVTGWSTPVDPRTGKVEPGSWLDKFSLEKEKEAGQQVIVIALSGVAVPRPAKKGDVTPVNDETVKQGADTLDLFMKTLKEKGADEVFVSSYHYFEKASAPEQRTQYDPEYSRRVFAAWNAGAGRGRGIDCLTLTRAHHPLQVGDDLFHPSKAGHAIYSHLWFEALLKHDGLEVPAWSREEMEAAVKQEQAERDRKKGPGTEGR